MFLLDINLLTASYRPGQAGHSNMLRQEVSGMLRQLASMPRVKKWWPGRRLGAGRAWWLRPWTLWPEISLDRLLGR